MQALLEIGLSNALAATVLAAIIWALTLYFRRAPLVRWLWLLVLLKLVTPPVVEIPLGPMLGFDGSVNTALSTNSVDPRTLGDDSSGLVLVETRLAVSGGPTGMDLADVGPIVLGSVWLAGSIVWFVVAMVRIYHFNRLVESADMAPEALWAEVRRLAKKFELRQPPEVRVAPMHAGPLVWAMWARPTVLLPAGLLEQLTAPQRATLLAHELAHLRRGDHWVRWLEFLVLGLYWWHPIVWYARRKLRQAEEECCDAWVLWALPDLARTYAKALIGAIDFLSEARPVRPVAATGLDQVPLLKRRFEMILHNGLCRHASWTTRLVMLAVTGLVLPLAPVARSAADPCEEESTSQGDSAECVASPSGTGDSQVAKQTSNKEELQAVQAYTIDCTVINQAKDGSKKFLSRPQVMMLEDQAAYLQIGEVIPLVVGENTTVRLVHAILIEMRVLDDGKDRVIMHISVALSKASEENEEKSDRIVTKRVYETACSVRLGEKFTFLFGEKPGVLRGESYVIPKDRITEGPEVDYAEFVVEKGPVLYETVSQVKARTASSPFVAIHDFKSRIRPNPEPARPVPPVPSVRR